jgi:hypothetical protein
MVVSANKIKQLIINNGSMIKLYNLTNNTSYKLQIKTKIMQKIIAFLDGKKTIIGSGIIFIAGGLKALSLIDESTFQIILSIGSAVTIYGIRSAISKIGK